MVTQKMFLKGNSHNQQSNFTHNIAHEFTLINALRFDMLSFNELHYIDESKISQPENLCFIRAAKASWLHEKERPKLDDITCKIFHTVIHENGYTKDQAYELIDSFDIGENEKPPHKNDVYVAVRALRLSNSALLAASNDDHTEESIITDADLISIVEKSPIAQFASELAKAAQVPRNTTFLTVLSIASAVCGRHAAVAYRDGSTQPTTLYFCGEQPPATAKSRVLKNAQAPVFNIVSERRKKLNKEITQLADDLELAEDKEEKVQIKKDISALQAERDSLMCFETDVTPESLDESLSNTNGFYSIASAEQGAVNTLLGINYSSDKGSNKDLILKGYNGEWHSSKRKSRKAYTGCVVGSICVLAQDGMINNVLKVSGNTGVIERFILWSEGHLLGKRDHLEYHKINEDILNAYHNFMTVIYGKIKADTDYDSLISLSMSNRSWHTISQLKQNFEPTLANDGVNSASVLRGVIGKIDILIMKVAAVLHLSIEQESSLIHDDRVNEAIELAKAYIQHLKGLVHGSGLELLSESEKLIIELITHKYMTGRDIAAKFHRNKQFLQDGKASRGNVQKVVINLLGKGIIKTDNKDTLSHDTVIGLLINAVEFGIDIHAKMQI